MAEITIRPIDQWPDGWRTDKDRQPNPFRSSYTDTLQLLDTELDHLDATTAQHPYRGPTVNDDTPIHPRAPRTAR